MPVTSLCRLWLSYGYDWLSYRKWLRPLSFRYDNPYGFLIDFFLIFSGRSLIDMTPTFFRIGMIMTAILLSRWLNSPIEMTATSYWYEGKERGFLTLCYLSIWVSFFLSLIQKIWRSFAINERHFLRWNDRSFWAPKILSMGQQIRAQKLSIFYHFNRTDDF